LYARLYVRSRDTKVKSSFTLLLRQLLVLDLQIVLWLLHLRESALAAKAFRKEMATLPK
jgi:hypothetical protein